MLRTAALIAVLLFPASASADCRALPGTRYELRDRQGKALRADTLRQMRQLLADTEEVLGRSLPGPWRSYLTNGVWPRWAPPPTQLPDFTPSKPKRPWWAVP